MAARIAGGSIDFDLVIVGVDESRKEVVDSLKKVESVAKQTRDKIADAWGSGIEKLRFGFDLIKSAVEAIRQTVAAFADRMGKAVSTAREMGIGIDQAQKAMKFAEISGISLEEAIEKVGASSKKAEAAQKENAKSMLQWRMLSSDLSDIMFEIGGELLRNIVPAFPKIVAGAKLLGDIFTNYVAPVIGNVLNAVLNIGPVLGEVGNIVLASFELAGTAITNEFKNWFGEFEKLGVAAVEKVLNFYSDIWDTIAKKIKNTSELLLLLNPTGAAMRVGASAAGDYASGRSTVSAASAERTAYTAGLGRQVDQERADRDAQTAAKWQESSKRIADASAKLGGLVATPPTDSQWDARLAKYMDAAMAPAVAAEAAAPVAKAMAEAPGRSAIMGSFSSFGISQRGGASGSEPQQQSVDLLRMINSGIMQLVRVQGGSLVAVSTGNPTRAELGAQ